jgi:hypothetical protein
MVCGCMVSQETSPKDDIQKMAENLRATLVGVLESCAGEGAPSRRHLSDGSALGADNVAAKRNHGSTDT